MQALQSIAPLIENVSRNQQGEGEPNCVLVVFCSPHPESGVRLGEQVSWIESLLKQLNTVRANH